MRVAAGQFVPSTSQKRLLKRHADLEVAACEPWSTQEQFDLLQDAKPVFGPAARPLPKLAITVDDEGYFVARHDFTEPIGPSFWERP